MPLHDECRDDGLIPTGRGSEEIDDRDLCGVYRYQPGLSADPDPEPREIGGTKEDAGMGTDTTSDIVRGKAVARLLFESFRSEGIHGRNDMPEDQPPLGVERGSLEHVLFITLTVAIDYQRDANTLWDSSRKAFADAETRYVFDPASVHAAEPRKVLADLSKHRVSKKPRKDCDIWRTVAITFHKKWRGDPRNFLADCGLDAVAVLQRLRADTHLVAGQYRPDYPYLRGPKIGPLWLRMLKDNVGLSIRRLDEVPIPVDVHIARASLATGIVRGKYDGGLDEIYERIRRAWAAAVVGLKADDCPMIALDVDEPLWHLSKYGCSTFRDIETGACRKMGSCEARAFCVPGKLVIRRGQVIVDT
jgi:hypothetical protein